MLADDGFLLSVFFSHPLQMNFCRFGYKKLFTRGLYYHFLKTF